GNVQDAAARGQSNYVDTVGDVFTGAGGGILDITSVEVGNSAFDLIFTINLAGNPVATDWGKYMIAFDTKPGGDLTGNGWGRPISMSSGMDYWVGTWVDGGNGGEVREYTGSWPIIGGPTVSKTTTNVTISFPFALLGLSPGDTFEFDVFTSGGGGGDGAIDSLANPVQSVANWGDAYDAVLKRSYTIANVPAQTNKVTFTVNMEVPMLLYANNPLDPLGFDATSDVLYVRGSFNGFTNSLDYRLFQVGTTTLFTNTVDVVATNGQTVFYKFFGDSFPGYEIPSATCGGNRSLTITAANMTAPLAYWNDSRVTDPTNIITFQADLAVQILTGAFNTNTDSVYVRGNFNGWSGPGLLLTNVPSTTLFQGSLVEPFFPTNGCKPLSYKFLINANYESGSNRDTNVTTLNPLLAGAYDRVTLCDVLEQTNFVTFTVNMTNAVGTDSTVYDTNTPVYINGNFTGWDLNDGPGDWGSTPKAELQMSRIGDTSLHTITLPIPPGHPLRLVYKFSMNGFDNEAGFAVDHVRYIRTTPGQNTYTLPLDTWIGTNTVAFNTREEAKFGNLKASPAGPGQVSVTWNGLKCVSLQTSTNLTGFVTDTNTTGLSATNIATGGAPQKFFRLVSPQ
ncbi:MAG: hypothetical protein ACK45B_12350, partial [Limisphaerales bacterium]